MANLLLDPTYTEEDYLNALRDDFKRRAPVYDSGANGTMHHELIDQLLTSYPFRSPVLDVACGTGYLCGQVVAGGGTATGLDLTREMLTEAQRQHTSAKFVEGRAERLPFDDESFESVYVCSALAYFVNISDFLQEARRVLSPHGFFAFQSASGDSYVIGLALQKACVQVLGAKRGAETFRVPNTVTDNEQKCREMLHKAGFEHVSVTEQESKPVLTLDDIKRTWSGGLFKNALLGRVARLNETEMEQVYVKFIECIEEKRGKDGVIHDKILSYFVQGWKP